MYLHQLSAQQVTYMCDAPMENAITDTTQIVLLVKRGITPADMWSKMVNQPRETASKWLKTVADVQCSDMEYPNVAGISLKMVIRVPAGKRAACLKASGQDGLFVNGSLEKPEDREEFQVIPLDTALSLEASRKLVVFHADAIGLVTTTRGLARRRRRGR